jgi:DNA repair photolyase
MLTIKRKSLLYKSGAGSGDFCINHVEGCSHGCNFPCYAMLMKKMSGRIKDYNDWLRPKLVENTLELLEKELPRLKNRINNVHLCFTTDPFMYRQPEVSDLTLKIMERLNKEGIKCTTLTKGIYPEELTDVKKYGKNNDYGITIISLDENFRKKYEPFTAPYKERIESLRYLHSRGLRTHISMEPYPTPNLIKQNLTEILEKIKFVDEIIFGKLNYNTQSDNFPGANEFYQKCVDQVKDFCKKNKKDYHIRSGTSEKEDKGKEKQIRKLDGILPLPI